MKSIFFQAFSVFIFLVISFNGNSQFLGGGFDGLSNAKVNNNSCKSVAVTPFTGGSSSGFASVRYGDTCYSVAITPFTGGISDGFASIRLGDTCYSTAVTPFSGGIADGFSNQKTTNDVCFSISVTPFSGGVADGFAHFSRIVVDPETCILLDPLPIELLRFDALKEVERVRTEWVTLSERENDYFTVEKSINGFHWDSIGSVKGAGNSSHKIEYALHDLNPITGIQYYRLKQIDFDGKHSYSEIKSVLYEKEDQFSITVYPNPTRGTVYMSVSNAELRNVKLLLYSSLGKAIYEYENFTGKKKEFDLTGYERGVYFLKVHTEDESKTFRIIKQ